MPYSGRGSNRKQARQPDAPLTANDRALLASLTRATEALGRTPTVAEVADAAAIKRRFGTWKNAVLAAGLPPLNDPEQMRLRQDARVPGRPLISK